MNYIDEPEEIKENIKYISFVLPPISDEQKLILDKMRDNNILVNSVAGSGKTTTALYITKFFSDKNIILITYSKKLKEDTRKKRDILNLKNLDVHSFHSLCFKYYKSNDFTDKIISDTLSENLISKIILNYDIFIIDEAQDMTKLYYEFICKVIHDNIKRVKLCIIGDEYQNIYGFKNSDSRYLNYSDQLFKFDDTSWITLNLSVSYRLTKQIANFINNCVINQNRIQTIKTGIKPRYVICNVFSFGVYYEVKYYLSSGYKYDDIFILAPSIIGKEHNPVRILSNFLTKFGIPIFRPKDDESDFDEKELENKISILTFHQSKGLQRKVVIVMSFDETYFKFFGKDWDPNWCPNPIYVAITRPIERLSVIHNERNKCLQFIDIYEIRKYCDVLCPSNIWKKLEQSRFDDNEYEETINKMWSVSYLIKYLDEKTINEALEKLEIIKIKKKKKKKIEINSKVKSIYDDKELLEDVSEINETSITSYFEFQMNNKLTIYDKVLNESKIKIKEIDLKNMTIDQLLYLSNMWRSICSGYMNQILQIKSYDWITLEDFEKCNKRIKKKHLSTNLKFIEKIDTYLHDIYLYDYIDCIDNKNIWNFLCRKQITDTFILHMGCVMYIVLKNFYEKNKKIIEKIDKLKKIKNMLNHTNHSKNDMIKIDDLTFKFSETDEILDKLINEKIDENIPKFYIYNIYDGEHIEIICDFQKLEKMMFTLIEKRIKKNDDVTDETFIENNISILDMYKINPEEIIGKYNEIEQKYKIIMKQLIIKEKELIEINNEKEKIIKSLEKFTGFNIDFIKDNEIGKTMILDIETTTNGNLIIQIAYIIINFKFEEIIRRNMIIKNDKNEIDHYKQITKEEVKYGMDPINVHKILQNDLNKCKRIIGHNIRCFDIPKIMLFFKKINLKTKFPEDVIDTMTKTRVLLNLKGKSGRLKSPKLEELYEFLFKKKVNKEKQHNAFYDVLITLECYKKLIENKILYFL